MTADAVLSDCGLYRYRLTRRWGDGPAVNFIMLNPSVADQHQDDPTIRKCVGFARRWEYHAIVVTNLFAFRATDPAAMKAAVDPVGPENNGHLVTAAWEATLVVAAWGVHGGHRGRDRTIRTLLANAGVHVHATRLTKDGHPWHPLMLSYSYGHQPWEIRP